MKKVKESLMFSVKATIFLTIMGFLALLVVPSNPAVELLVSFGNSVLEIVVTFIFFFVLDYVCRLIFSGHKPDDGVPEDATELK
jgi:hypothetical protein